MDANEINTENTTLLSSDDFEALIRTGRKQWQRKTLVYDDDVPDDQINILFQILDIVPCIAFPIESIYREKLYDSTDWIRCYGVSDDGLTVCVHVYGFMPYILASVPDNFNFQKCSDLMDQLNKKFSEKFNLNSHAIRSIVPVDFKEDIPSRNLQYDQVIKISIYRQSYLSNVVELLEDVTIKFIPGFEIEIFEDTLELTTRFLADTKLHGCSWIKVPLLKSTQLAVEKQQTTCQIELLVYYGDIICADYDSHCQSLYAPFKLLSFDIECLSKKEKFCKPQEDPVITIGNVVRDTFDPNQDKFNIVFALGTSSRLKDAEVYCFKSEIDLLRSWNFFIRLLDPDILIGHNIVEFDLKYLHTRACELKIKNFGNLGRNVIFSEADHDFIRFNLTGRIVFDSYPIVKKERPYLMSYKLVSLSKHLLNDSKVEMDINLIGELFNGTDMNRALINSYCLKDALLPLKIFDRINIFQKYVELVRFSRVPLKDLLTETRFNSRICLIPMLRSAHESMRILKRSNNYNFKSDPKLIDLPSMYHKLFYNSLLFASIIIEFNLCYSTIIRNDNIQQFCSTNYIRSPCGSYVFKKNFLLGIIPRTLLKFSAQLKNNRNKLRRQNNTSKNKRLIYCKILAIKTVLKTFPGVLMAPKSQYFFPSIQKNVCAYFNILSDMDKMKLEKQYFG